MFMQTAQPVWEVVPIDQVVGRVVNDKGTMVRATSVAKSKSKVFVYRTGSNGQRVTIRKGDRNSLLTVKVLLEYGRGDL